jgi:hypothetical protein
VYDGNAQSMYVFNGHLNIDGDQFGTNYNDSIAVGTNAAGGVTVTLNGEFFSFDPGKITGISVFAGGGYNSISINSTTAAAGVAVNADGFDAVYLGGGNLDNLQGYVNVYGNGATGIQLQDDANARSDTYTVTGSTVGRPFFAGLSYFSASYAVLSAEAGNNTINVNGTSATTYIYGDAGNDTVNVGTGNLGSILGGVYVQDYTGTDLLTINDSTSPYAGPYTITSSLVNAPGSFVNGVSYGGIDRIIFSAAAGDNTITVASVAAGVAYTLNGDGGNDTLVGQGTANAWRITSLNGGYVGTVAFSSMENLTGGAGDDAFFLSNGKGVSGRINGGGGVRNWINDTAYTTPVTVNLTTGAATGVGGGISNIQNVMGGAANDTITGDAGNNTLIGGAGDDTVNGQAGNDVLLGGLGNDNLLGGDGRDLLVGGSGADVLDGGNDDDILIGGLISYYSEANNTLSANLFAAIMGEWTSAFDYATRIQHLTGALAGGRNGTTRINSTTVSNDGGAADTLFGRAGLDWFVVSTADLVKDLNTGGTETKTTI